ncbi:MAG: DUF2075 domain-containing protein [Verrucomicrobiota bacterium]
MSSAYYSADIDDFLCAGTDSILGQLTLSSEFDVVQAQREAWLSQINILRGSLSGLSGRLYFEFVVPRIGQRIDVLLLSGATILVLEFKVGEKNFARSAIDQVWDYGLDLKNFHETSHDAWIAPILVATEAKPSFSTCDVLAAADALVAPIKVNGDELRIAIERCLSIAEGPAIDPNRWERGRYRPTPTIVDAALALYNDHDVTAIARRGASETNLSTTSDTVDNIIRISRERSEKAICFVTGVPGAGKTLVGLNVATKHIQKESELYSVFLSGNGPLVEVLREALAKDKVYRENEEGNKITMKRARSEVKTFIQNVHHFRDACINDLSPPLEHVALFDEAQRAWNLRKTADFMKRRKGRHDFELSEPEFLMSCLDRHEDWAVVVCLVGGGQEIHSGEAGIGEWIAARNRSFQNWKVYISPELNDSEYELGETRKEIEQIDQLQAKPELHLNVSMRSFKAGKLSLFVKQLLDLEVDSAKTTLAEICDSYPIRLARDFPSAKKWVRSKARGNERFGMVVSSQAVRLKPYAIDVRSPMNPVHWFLNEKEDVRSSYYLEDVATEFHIQGLEIDWACVSWDGDFRFHPDGWRPWSFRGNKWQRIRKEERQLYIKNAYRVLLTRARQGMVIIVPRGDSEDPTRNPEFYDSTYSYLASLGIPSI